MVQQQLALRPLTPTLSPPGGEREGPAQREGEGRILVGVWRAKTR